MRSWLFALACFAVACGPARAPERPSAENAQVAKLPEPPAKPDWTALRASLEHTKLAGFALLGPNARLSPKREVAANAPAAPGGRAYVTILEDLGAVVRVRTGLGSAPLDELDAAYDLEAYVPRASLETVLTHAIVKDAHDGTGIVLLEGLELDLGDRISPHGALLAKLPVEVGQEDVGLSFALSDAKLPEVPAVRLGCLSKGEATRVAELTALEEEERGPFMIGMRGGDRFPCRLMNDLDVRWYPDRHDAPLVVGGVAIGKASETHERSIDTRRTSDGRTLVTLDLGRARVRASTKDSALIAGGSGGGGGALMMGGKRPMIWQVSGAAPAYFPDGTRAGTHVGQPTRLRNAKEIDGRVCIDRAYLTVPICHEKADLQQVEDRGY